MDIAEVLKLPKKNIKIDAKGTVYVGKIVAIVKKKQSIYTTLEKFSFPFRHLSDISTANDRIVFKTEEGNVCIFNISDINTAEN